MIEADKTACDYCAYVREEKLLLDAHDYLMEALKGFEFAKMRGKKWDYVVDAARRRFLLEYVKDHPDYREILTAYIKEFSTMGVAVANLKSDARMFRIGRRHIKCKCHEPNR